MAKKPINVLFFIGSLQAGGKERRLIELLFYLKNRQEYKMMVLVTTDKVHFPDFFKLGIPYKKIGKVAGYNNSLIVFSEFYRVCKEFKPDIIHSWGRIQTLYTLPAVLLQRIPLINSQITAAPPKYNRWTFYNLIDRINFKVSRLILSNSFAGVLSFQPPKQKARVIYNGINLRRFENLPSVEAIKAKYSIETVYSVVMTAAFSNNKDYELFCKIANMITSKRQDVTFVGVGAIHNNYDFRKLALSVSGNHKVKLLGRIDEVEALVNACNIGLLFSNKAKHGEGISNSIVEYMALSKPVIANDAGGTKEVVYHKQNGYLVTDESNEEIVQMINELLDNKEKCKSFGNRSKQIVEEKFSLEEMGKAFEQSYFSAMV
jgi:glycosyltransferase involved in cell wall biosynthesis